MLRSLWALTAGLLGIMLFLGGCVHPRETKRSETPKNTISEYILFKSKLMASRNPLCADLNGDGLTDVAIVEKAPYLNVFYNTPSGLKKEVKYETFSHNTYLAAVDFDSDGLLDLIPITEWTIGPIFMNKKDNFKREEFSTGVPKFGYVLKAADMNNDGLQDLVAGGLHADELKILYQKAKGTFDSVSVPTKTAASSGSEPSGMKDLIVYDINNDGLKDIVFGTYFNGELMAAINSQSGEFALKTIVGFNYTISSVGIVPLNNRKHIIAVALESKKSVVLLEGNGNGDYKQFVEIKMKGAPRKIVIDDFDNDGVEDVIVANHTRDNRGSWLNIISNLNKTLKVSEAFVDEHDCLYLSVCDIYGKKDILCSDINRGQFFIIDSGIFTK